MTLAGLELMSFGCTFTALIAGIVIPHGQCPSMPLSMKLIGSIAIASLAHDIDICGIGVEKLVLALISFLNIMFALEQLIS